MTQPTIDQPHNLTDRAAHGLTADEQQRLRDGLARLEHAEAAIEAVAEVLADHNGDDWSRHPATQAVAAAITLRALDTRPAATQATDPGVDRQTAAVPAALHRSAEADVSRVIALYERWVTAGPPPLGTSINRWWDTRLAELTAALNPKETP